MDPREHSDYFEPSSGSSASNVAANFGLQQARQMHHPMAPQFQIFANEIEIIDSNSGFYNHGANQPQPFYQTSSHFEMAEHDMCFSGIGVTQFDQSYNEPSSHTISGPELVAYPQQSYIPVIPNNSYPMMPSVALETVHRFSARNKTITNEEWESKREDIRRIYILENRSLEYTMETMRECFNFHATKPMYKSRFHFWDPDFRKNATKNNGGNVPGLEDRQPRHRQDSRLSEPQVESPAASIQHAKNSLENLVNQIRGYLDKIFLDPQKAWTAGKLTFQPPSSLPTHGRPWELLFRQSQEVSTLARSGQQKTVKYVLDQLFSSMEQRLSDENLCDDPNALVYFFRIAIVFHGMRRRGSQRLERNRMDLLR
ncbi:hypothetical protein ACHAPJ_006716, partial [Fusarium lateritium]